MSKKRSLAGLLIGCIGLASGVALFSAPVSAAGCTVTETNGIYDVQCPGGAAGVKRAMKEAVDAANRAGERVNGSALDCKTCHVTLTDFRLKANAHQLFGDVLEPYFE